MDSLMTRLGQYIDINPSLYAVLTQLDHRLETLRSGESIVQEGEDANFVFVIESGWAIRYRMLDDGRRQVLNFMIPGDCFDLMSLIQAKSDHSVSAATKVVLRRIPAPKFIKAISAHPSLAAAFWCIAIQEEGILREQIIRVGRRTAREGLAHMILELNRRVAMTKGKQTDFVDLPVMQSLLADALGLSVVHISRTLTKLKTAGYIETKPDGIKILDRDGLSKLANFDSQYLHMEPLNLLRA